jgi:hypothetical protein
LQSDQGYIKQETYSFEMKDDRRVTPDAKSSSKVTGFGLASSLSLNVNATPTKVTSNNSQDVTPLSTTEIKPEKDSFDYKNIQNIRINT